MAFFERRYPGVEESVNWKAYDGSYYHYDSDGSYGRPYHSNKIVLHVPMCCDECVQKVRKSLQNVSDVDSVDIDIGRQRVVVRGHLDPERALRKVRKQIRTAVFWDSAYGYGSSYSSTGASDYPYRSTPSVYNYKYYGHIPSDRLATNYSTTAAYEQRLPTLIIDRDYDYYGYANSDGHSGHNDNSYLSYPSHSDFYYKQNKDYHLFRSYDAQRYH